MTKKEMIYMDRPHSNHTKMSNNDRAKQFAPFAALKGFGKKIKNTTEPTKK